MLTTTRGAKCAADLQVTIVTAHGLRDRAARRRRDDWGTKEGDPSYPDTESDKKSKNSLSEKGLAD